MKTKEELEKLLDTMKEVVRHFDSIDKLTREFKRRNDGLCCLRMNIEPVITSARTELKSLEQDNAVFNIYQDVCSLLERLGEPTVKLIDSATETKEKCFYYCGEETYGYSLEAFGGDDLQYSIFDLSGTDFIKIVRADRGGYYLVFQAICVERVVNKWLLDNHQK